MLKRYAVRIFDGTFTRVYTTKTANADQAQERAEIQHIGRGYKIVSITVTEIGK
jgi:hypothetical protein